MSFTFHNVSIKTILLLFAAQITLTLHSTMFLLKLEGSRQHRRGGQTLHSTMFLLKPGRRRNLLRNILPLHSTMFLLKPVPISKVRASLAFTFHNVSIKSSLPVSSTICVDPLHSTMFLLKPVNPRCPGIVHSFFTFHNVSIKTNCVRDSLITLENLYIPQCFY